jgi:UDP-N-acetylmuramoyl-tripeptide--D-alanyl-D-alanine ligase
MVYRPGKNVLLIDDTFNANPESVTAALDILEHVGCAARIAVLGSMAELGKLSGSAHRSVGRHLAKKKLDYLYTFGKHAELIGLEAVESGFKAERVKHFSDKEAMHQQLLQDIRPGTTILVKGSHNMKMHETVRFIRTYIDQIPVSDDTGIKAWVEGLGMEISPDSRSQMISRLIRLFQYLLLHKSE